MEAFNIKWQRLLVDESGQTCPRCGSTENELDKAVHVLEQSLAPLGMEVVFEKKVLEPAVFTKDALESNRIWIVGRPLEDWLGAEVGQSHCCEVCGDAECRTVEIGRDVYETIPAGLIIRAGLIAASRMITAGPEETCCPEPQDNSN
jgi:hypothetical protein